MILTDKEKQTLYQRGRYKINAEHRLVADYKVKVEVLTHYGSGKCSCFKCGFSDIRALTLDHVNGRKESSDKHGQRLYRRLKGDGYPEGYMTLCMNCQFIKKVENREINQWT